MIPLEYVLNKSQVLRQQTSGKPLTIPYGIKYIL
jgi:hypothetical protein